MVLRVWKKHSVQNSSCHILTHKMIHPIQWCKACLLWSPHSGGWWSWFEAHSIYMTLTFRCCKDGLQLKKKLLQFIRMVLKFHLYLIGAECILHCDHKRLESFLLKDMKIPKLDWWAMELAGYSVIFVHIKGNRNNLADAISRLKY